MWTYVAAVEEVSKREQRGEDVAESFVLLQLLHSLLQILQRFCHFLQTARSTFGDAGYHQPLSKNTQKHMFRRSR